MNLQKTPSSLRIHIGIFGNRNSGKSSLMNQIIGQDLSIVSPIEGTTTDPVSKSMELLPIGPVVLIDTPGLDDVGFLGMARVEKAKQILNKIHIALLVVDGSIGITKEDEELFALVQKKKLPFLLVWNKEDEMDLNSRQALPLHVSRDSVISVSAKNGTHITELKEALAGLWKKEKNPESPLVSDCISSGDYVFLVTPIDSSAPKGRLILPQQQVLRDIIDHHGKAIVLQPEELEDTLSAFPLSPALVITDSQVFSKVSKIVPISVPLTSFSILMARFRGNLKDAVSGAHWIDRLHEDAHILMAEGCTHHRQCEDIGTVKLPRLLKKHTGKQFQFTWVSGTEYPSDLSKFDLIIHCGGCMTNEKEMKYRYQLAKEQQIPITNYGIAIAHMTGILERSIAPLHL